MPRLKDKDARFLIEDRSSTNRRIFIPLLELSDIVSAWLERHAGLVVDEADAWIMDTSAGHPGLVIVKRPKARA